MTVTVLLFAALRESKGTDRLDVELRPGETAHALFDRLFVDRPHPRWPGALLFAVNREYVDRGHALQDGDEVAFVPPLGGGEGEDGRVSLHHERIPEAEVVARVAGPDKGGLCVFTGWVRDHHAGRAVTRLEYEAYEPMAVQEMSRICDAVALRWPGVDAVIAAAGDRRRGGGHRLRFGPPRGGLRGVPVRDRHPQGDGADLQEGVLRGRQRLEGAGRWLSSSSGASADAPI
jgi:molybdopterin converting factor small subunit